ncbi:hypothetical protein L3Y34_013790 [Caenorhabditis briggsae]|nr:hypothetical protein L3Y34_013790 [Caenorhabditis briggsae]
MLQSVHKRRQVITITRSLIAFLFYLLYFLDRTYMMFNALQNGTNPNLMQEMQIKNLELELERYKNYIHAQQEKFDEQLQAERSETAVFIEKAKQQIDMEKRKNLECYRMQIENERNAKNSANAKVLLRIEEENATLKIQIEKMTIASNQEKFQERNKFSQLLTEVISKNDFLKKEIQCKLNGINTNTSPNVEKIKSHFEYFIDRLSSNNDDVVMQWNDWLGA